MVIGTSLGGLHALEVILGGLPRGFALPIAVVQHRDRQADGMLNAVLQRSCSLPVSERERPAVFRVPKLQPTARPRQAEPLSLRR